MQILKALNCLENLSLTQTPIESGLFKCVLVCSSYKSSLKNIFIKGNTKILICNKSKLHRNIQTLNLALSSKPVYELIVSLY